MMKQRQEEMAGEADLFAEAGGGVFSCENKGNAIIRVQHKVNQRKRTLVKRGKAGN